MLEFCLRSGAWPSARVISGSLTFEYAGLFLWCVLPLPILSKAQRGQPLPILSKAKRGQPVILLRLKLRELRRSWMTPRWTSYNSAISVCSTDQY